MKKTSTRIKRWATIRSPAKHTRSGLSRRSDEATRCEFGWPKNRVEETRLAAEFRVICNYKAYERLMVIIQAIRARERGLLALLVKHDLQAKGLVGQKYRCQTSSCQCYPTTQRRRRLRHRRYSSAETVDHQPITGTSGSLHPIEELAKLKKIAPVLEKEARRKYAEAKKAINNLIECCLPYQSLWMVTNSRREATQGTVAASQRLFTFPALNIAASPPFYVWMPFLQHLLFFAPYEIASPPKRDMTKSPNEWEELLYRSSLAGTLDADVMSTYDMSHKPTLGFMANQWQGHIDLWLHYALSLALNPYQLIRSSAALHTCVCLLYKERDKSIKSGLAGSIPEPKYAHILWILVHQLVKLGYSGLQLAIAHSRHLLTPEANVPSLRADILHVIGVCMILLFQFDDPLQLPDESVVPVRRAEKYLQEAHRLKPNNGRIALNLTCCRLLLHQLTSPELEPFSDSPNSTQSSWLTPEIEADFASIQTDVPKGVHFTKLLPSARTTAEHAYRVLTGASPLAASLLVIASLRTITLEKEILMWWRQGRENPEYERAFAFLRWNAWESVGGAVVHNARLKTSYVSPYSQVLIVTTLQVLSSWLYHISGSLSYIGQQLLFSPFTDAEQARLNRACGLPKPVVNFIEREPVIRMLRGEIASWIDALILCTLGASVLNGTTDAFFPLSQSLGYPIPSIPRSCSSSQKPTILGHDLFSIMRAQDMLTGILQSYDQVANQLTTQACGPARILAHKIPARPGPNPCGIPWILRARQQTKTPKTESESIDPAEEDSVENISFYPCDASDLLPVEVVIMACLEAAHSSRQKDLAEKVYQMYTQARQDIFDTTATVGQHITKSHHLVITGLHQIWQNEAVEAQHTLLESISLNPRNIQARILLARAYFADDLKRDSALVRLDQCMRLCPSSQICKCLYGHLMAHVFRNYDEQRELGMEVLKQYSKGCPVGNMNIISDVGSIINLEV